MRLIDADKFKEDLMKLWDYSCVDGITATTVLKQVIQDLDNAPTVTPSLNLENVTEEDIKKFRLILQRATCKGLPTFVEERPQGEWARHDEWVGGEYVGGFYHVNCPCIDLEKAFYSKWRTNFCPNCGLPMQKGGAE